MKGPAVTTSLPRSLRLPSTSFEGEIPSKLVLDFSPTKLVEVKLGVKH